MQLIRAIYGLILFGLAVLVLAPLQLLALVLRLRPVHVRIPILFHKFVSRYAFGMRITVRGTPEKPNPHPLFRWPNAREVRGPVLYVSNHNSWSDIIILGSITPLCFVAKAEVADWPGFGILSKMQRTIFVKREDTRKAGEQAAEMLGRMDGGDAIVLFAEGTSSDGNRVLPFKSSLFAVAQMSDIRHSVPPVRIQPVSIAFTKVGGLPMGRQYRPYFAWYGDMEFGGHLWEGLMQGPADVEVTFHPPVTLAQMGNRKKLANAVHRTVSEGLAHAITGRGIPDHNEAPANALNDGPTATKSGDSTKAA